MFRRTFKSFYFAFWRSVTKSDLKRASKYIISSNIDISSFYINEKEDYSNLIKVYKNKKLDGIEKPLIINVHGGGWVLKNWGGYDPFYSYIASNGYDSIGFSYCTMIDGYKCVEIIRHIFDVFHYIYDNHKKLNISLNNVFLAGDSAGGQMSLFIYAINNSEQLQKIYGVKPFKFDIKGLILSHTVAFIDEAFTIPNHPFISRKILNQSFVELMFGKKYKTKDEFIYLNPYKYFPLIKEFPPIIVVTSFGDQLFKSNSIKLHNTLTEFNIKHDYYFEEDPTSDHVFNISMFDTPIGIKCNQYIDKFIKNTIKTS